MIKLSTIDIYNSAYQFWHSELNNHQEATWDEFISHFVRYIQKNARFDLNEEQIRNLRNLIDPQLNMAVSLREFIIFYEKQWNNIHARRKILKEEVPFPNLFEKQYFWYNLTLTVEKAPKRSLVKVGDEFNLQKLDLKSLMHDTKFDKTFGKEGCDHAIIPSKDMDYYQELFRITPYANGYKVKCNERNQRLKFKVEDKPYILMPGMVIQIGLNSFFKVIFANPVPKEKHNELYTLFNYEKDEFFEYLTEKKVESPDDYNLQFLKFKEKYAHELSHEKKVLRLMCIKGPEKGQLFEFVEKLSLRQLRYSIGRVKSANEFHLSDVTVSSTHCIIAYNGSFGWSIHEETPSALGTYIYLANSNQYEKGAPSYPHEISNDMKLAVNDFVFGCKLKKVDERLENIIAKMQKDSSPKVEK